MNHPFTFADKALVKDIGEVVTVVEFDPASPYDIKVANKIRTWWVNNKDLSVIE